MPRLQCGLRRAWGTTFCTSLSPRRGHTRRDDRMRRRVGPKRAGHTGLRAETMGPTHPTSWEKSRTGAPNRWKPGHRRGLPRARRSGGAAVGVAGAADAARTLQLAIYDRAAAVAGIQLAIELDALELAMPSSRRLLQNVLPLVLSAGAVRPGSGPDTPSVFQKSYSLALSRAIYRVV